MLLELFFNFASNHNNNIYWQNQTQLSNFHSQISQHHLAPYQQQLYSINPATQSVLTRVILEREVNPSRQTPSVSKERPPNSKKEQRSYLSADNIHADNFGKAYGIRAPIGRDNRISVNNIRADNRGHAYGIRGNRQLNKIQANVRNVTASNGGEASGIVIM